MKLIILLYVFLFYRNHGMAASPTNQSMLEGTWTSNTILGEDNLCCVPNRVAIFPWNDTYSNISLQFNPNNSNCLNLYDQSDFVVGGVSWDPKQSKWLTNIQNKQSFTVNAPNKTSLSFKHSHPDPQTCPFMMQRKITSLQEILDDMMGYWSEVTVTYVESNRCCYPDYIRPINNARQMTYKFSDNSSLCDHRIFKTGDMRFEPADQQANSIYEFDTGETVFEEVNVRLSQFSQESSLLLITHNILNFNTNNYERCSYYLSKKTATVPNITRSDPLNIKTSDIRSNVSNSTNSTAMIISSQASDSDAKVIMLTGALLCTILIVLVTIIIFNRKSQRRDKEGIQMQDSVEEIVDYTQMAL